MSARHIQLLLASIFLGLGGWCLVSPQTVEMLVFRPEFRDTGALTPMLVGCFGAQAMLTGAVIALSEFRPRTFLIFGLIGSLPFFGFNYYFYFVAGMFTDWMLLDFAGNLGILACGVAGYRLKRSEANEPPAAV